MAVGGGENLAPAVAADDSQHCEVEVSPLEARKFRVLTLVNKLKVFLVSDDSTDKAAAALDVSVGHFSDPWELPGLAHFCEHMLFLGTAKYPEEGSYRKLLAENSGYSNAYTNLENTNYHFQLVVPANDLESDDNSYIPRFKEALDRFSQFFIAPLFTESATEREANAVDSEHNKNLQRDGSRLFQVHKSLSNPEHPYTLLDFHAKYYSANLMHLCISGPYSLDVLEAWAIELFSAIPNHEAPHPSTEYRDIMPLLPDQTGRLIYVDPIKDIRRLELTWVIPSLDETYRSKPSYYLSHILGHEGKGSLLSLLKQKGWVDTLAAGPCREVAPFAFFIVSMDLTMEGAKKADEILDLLFGYLRLIRERGVQRWIFDETASLAALSFRFQERCEPYSFVQAMSVSMSKHPPAHYISGPYLLRDYVPDEIHEILNILTPQLCNVMIIGKFVKDRTVLVEPWYQTAYGKEPIPADKLQRWSLAKPDEAVGIPPKNMFVPTDLSMLVEPLPSLERDLEGPAVIEENKHFKLYYKLDRTFNRPKAAIHMDLYSSVAYQCPRSAILSKIFTTLVVDELNEFSYDADVAGLHYHLLNCHNGLQLTVIGYSHKIGILIDKIFERMANFKTNPERFHVIFDQIHREHMNSDKDQGHQHAMYIVSHLLEQPRWHIREYVNVLNEGSITPEAIDAFVPTLLERMYIVAMVGGNLAADWSKQLLRRIQRMIGYAPLPASERIFRRITKLPTGYEFVSRITHPNPNDGNSAVKLWFQLGPRGDCVRDVTVELLGELLNKPSFHELRTVQQLGYMVFNGVSRNEGVRGLFIMVQSPQFGPDELLVRIKKFLVDVRRDTLEQMSEEEFGAYVSSMRALKLERKKNIFCETLKFWNEVMRRECVFDRELREADALLQVTKQDVLELFDKYIAEEGSERRFLVAMVHGNLHERPKRGAGVLKTEKNHNPIVEIEDAYAFRNWCGTFPVTGISVEDVTKIPETM